MLTALGAAAAWTAIDWLRGLWPLGGFTWGSLGVSQVPNGITVRVAVVAGVFGATFVVAFASASAVGAVLAFKRPGHPVGWLFLALGVMVPIRLGTVGILEIMARSGLVNTLTALILVYTAQGLPLAVFVRGDADVLEGIAFTLRDVDPRCHRFWSRRLQPTIGPQAWLAAAPRLQRSGRAHTRPHHRRPRWRAPSK